MMTIHSRDSSSGAPLKRVAIAWLAPLLGFAVTQCGGKATDSQPAAAGPSSAGASSPEPATPSGGAAPVGGLGQAGVPSDSNILLPPGELPSSSDCNSLSEVSPSVTATLVAAEPPAPQGGTLSNGLYHLS